MKNSDRWTVELGQALKCSMPSCSCEGTKTFADRPHERYCSDCYEVIKSMLLIGTVPR